MKFENSSVLKLKGGKKQALANVLKHNGNNGKKIKNNINQ